MITSMLKRSLIVVALLMAGSTMAAFSSTSAHVSHTAESADGSCAQPATAWAQEPSWGQTRVGADRAWDLTRGDVLVAVVDTGVSDDSAALNGAVDAGVSLVGGGGREDCFGRGTFIASLIAGRPHEESPAAGVAPDARIFPVKITNDPKRIDDDLPNRLAEGISAAVARGARIVATGVSVPELTPRLRSALEQTVRAGVLLIAPAGGATDGGVLYPAGFDGVLAVAPLGADGPVAPAELGASPVVASPSDDLIGAAPHGDGDVTASDPSLAVGYVAGAAALVMAQDSSIQADAVVSRLATTADAPTTGYRQGEDPSVGFGVIDPVAAVTRLSGSGGGKMPTIMVDAPPAPAPDVRAALIALGVGGAVLLLGVFLVGPVLALGRPRIAEKQSLQSALGLEGTRSTQEVATSTAVRSHAPSLAARDQRDEQASSSQPVAAQSQ